MCIRDSDTSLYGQQREPTTEPPDPAREQADYLLLDDAEAHRKPVLAICFGTQSLNVWRGGSLVQDLAPLPVNHPAGSKVAVAHAALIAKDSLLASLLDPAETTESGDFLRLMINSSHHQSIACLLYTSRCV